MIFTFRRFTFTGANPRDEILAHIVAETPQDKQKVRRAIDFDGDGSGPIKSYSSSGPEVFVDIAFPAKDFENILTTCKSLGFEDKDLTQAREQLLLPMNATS